MESFDTNERISFGTPGLNATFGGFAFTPQSLQITKPPSIEETEKKFPQKKNDDGLLN